MPAIAEGLIAREHNHQQIVAWMESWNKPLPSHKHGADHAIELRVGVDAHCDTSKLQVSRPSEQSLSDIKSKNSRCLHSNGFSVVEGVRGRS
jgi:hypothetical protein